MSAKVKPITLMFVIIVITHVTVLTSVTIVTIHSTPTLYYYNECRYSVNDNRIVSQMFDMGIDIHDNHDEHDSMMKTMD
mgnify:FL=1